LLPLAKLMKNSQEKLQGLLRDFQELSVRVYALEEENAKLRRELALSYYRGGQEQNDLACDEGDVGQGLKNLVTIYEKGFHICNLSFGLERANDCLFCQALLQKSGAE